MIFIYNITMTEQCLNDNCYNSVHQITKTLEFLSHADQYIADAKKAGDSEAEKVWNTIKNDRQKHAEMLKGLLVADVKNNKF